MTRSEEFSGGADRVRSPQFQSVQQQSNRNFTQTSVLDQVLPGQNGQGTQDYQRKIMGRVDSPNARSNDTFEKQMWLHHAVGRKDQMRQAGQA